MSDVPQEKPPKYITFNMQKLKEVVEESHKRTTFNSHNNKLTYNHVDISQKHQVE